MWKTTAPVPTAFLPWKIAGLLWSVRQGSRALEHDLGTLHRNQLFSRSPTFSDLQTLLKTQASRKVTGTKAPTVCFQQGCARIPCSCQSHHLKLVQDHIPLQLKRLHFFFCHQIQTPHVALLTWLGWNFSTFFPLLATNTYTHEYPWSSALPVFSAQDTVFCVHHWFQSKDWVPSLWLGW